MTEQAEDPGTAQPQEAGLKLSSWVVTEGAAGMENQCLGIAEALGLTPQIKRIHPKAPWKWLPANLWPAPFAALGPDSDPLTPPWPDLLIACGRMSIPYAIAIRARSAGHTFTVQCQHPRVPIRHFDLVVPPEHDRLTGPNVLPILGAPNRITPEKLAAAAKNWRDRFAHLPRPLVAVVIGGPSKVYRMTEESVARLCANLKKAADSHGAGFVVTASRRTPPPLFDMLKQSLSQLPAWLWEGEGENPYFGMLGLADAIVVTEDSVNMATEAAATGKPVHIAALEGGSAKFHRFHESLRARGIARPFDGTLEPWTYPPLQETRRVAERIRRDLAARIAAPDHNLSA